MRFFVLFFGSYFFRFFFFSFSQQILVTEQLIPLHNLFHVRNINPILVIFWQNFSEKSLYLFC